METNRQQATEIEKLKKEMEEREQQAALRNQENECEIANLSPSK